VQIRESPCASFFVLYAHPGELEPSHSSASAPMGRRFKCYINIASTERKPRHLLPLGNSIRMHDFTVASGFARETLELVITT
jgi:hypothetical protein